MASMTVIREASKNDIPEVAKIYCETFPDFTKSLLGQRTVEKYFI